LVSNNKLNPKPQNPQTGFDSSDTGGFSSPDLLSGYQENSTPDQICNKTISLIMFQKIFSRTGSKLF